MDVNLSKLYSEWSSKDTHFAKLAAQFQGIRMLRQDPTETLFAFICSSNNHISRISSMMEKLCSRYGSKMATVGEETFYAFPAVETLAGKGVESELRGLGFGYRAKYVSKTAQMLSAKTDKDYLDRLRTVCYSEALEELVQFPGVGRKVADCVCLMSLDKHDVIPVDTHVWQIAARDYLPHLAKHKTLNEELRKRIGKQFLPKTPKWMTAWPWQSEVKDIIVILEIFVSN